MRPDEGAFAVPTILRARSAKIVLALRWRSEIEVEAIRIDRSNPLEWIARGGATFRLGELRAELKDELKITFLDDHEHFILYATDVELVERTVGYIHRYRNLHSVTIADDKLSLFSR